MSMKPELPQMPLRKVIDKHLPTGLVIYGYKSYQMRAYGEACWHAAYEHAASVIESTYPSMRDGEIVHLPCFENPKDCAEALRAMRWTKS